MSISSPILIAIPDEWQKQVFQHLETQGYSLISANSQDEALAIVQSGRELLGVILVSDWAMPGEKTASIIKLLQEKVPTITLITEKTRQESGYLYVDEVFFPPMHEYMTVPFDLDELEGRVRKLGVARV